MSKTRLNGIRRKGVSKKTRASASAKGRGGDSGGMGRKTGALYINPKRFGSLQKPCMKEMISFLNCLALCQNNDENCTRQKELLSSCMNAQSSKSRNAFQSINYHLQRLNRGRK